MSRTLGVHCDPHSAYLAVVEDDTVVDCGHDRERLDLPRDDAEALNVLLDQAVQLVRALRVDGVGVLMAESQAPGAARNQSSLVQRTALETVIRVAAVRAGVPVELTSRPTVRTRLDLPKKGKLEGHLGTILPNPVGRYWTAGRGLAAVAALAVGKVHATSG